MVVWLTNLTTKVEIKVELGKPDAEPLRIQNPAKHLDHAKKEVVAARYFDIPAAAIEAAVQTQKYSGAGVAVGVAPCGRIVRGTPLELVRLGGKQPAGSFSRTRTASKKTRPNIGPIP